MKAELYQSEFNQYVEKEQVAVDLQHRIGKLLFEKGVELVLFRNPLNDISVSEILQLHDYAATMVQRPISVHDTAALAGALLSLPVSPSKLDIGLLAAEWQEGSSSALAPADFLSQHLGDLMGDRADGIVPKDVVLYGFGRIGRLAARELIKQAGKGQQLRLRAVVVRGLDDAQLKKRAYLLRNDSVHGPFKGSIVEDYPNAELIINGQRVKFIDAANPEDVDYTQFGIADALLIDNTGKYTTKEALERHLKAKGISKVLLTAPGKEMPNVVYGVNHKGSENETVVSAASCTTNAIVPVLKVIHDKLGVVKGHIETVHAYTNDQNLLDNYHKKERRGRSAAINMVITETGAGKAVTKAIPELKDKLTANAVRVPIPNGSLAILSLTVNENSTLETVTQIMRDAALNGDLVNQIHFNINSELVSSDIVGNTCCSVFDSNATIVHPDGKSLVLYVWYDNEFGYTKQVIRLAKYMANVRRSIYY